MTSLSSDQDAELNRLASVRMESGIALLTRGEPEGLQEAIRYFDEAIELRRQLPFAQVPGFRYGLAAGWINRGDALTRLGGPENLVEAVKSYTTAIELLQDPPVDDDGTFMTRLGIAWLNRGIALEMQNIEPAAAEAVLSYRKAKDAAEQALPLLAENELKAVPAADAGLKARHVLCQAITGILRGTVRDTAIEPDLIDKITDTVEGALSLTQTWEDGGDPSFRPMATGFFHLGALVYERHQPHFLAEYLLDHLDPHCTGWPPAVSQTWLAIAEESLSRTRRELRISDFASLATPEGMRRVEILNEMQAAETRIQILRNHVSHNS
jgi:tetratricopeptide (TPR) repeat protein